MPRPPHPISHYCSVALLYRASAGRRDRVGPIAETYDVPRSTVHRWLKRARELGVLEASAKVWCPRCGRSRADHRALVGVDSRDACIALLKAEIARLCTAPSSVEWGA